ncbi:MFS transporter [Pseudonocardia yuanmonensis]|uniref:MFS transporter n=1 Tax=Pseudonocardia yuanmonensis TaxID=1095914 RepID=A0ABP8XLQ0_9PSEU
MTTTPPERPAAASTAPAGTPPARSPYAVLAVTSLALALVLINGTSINVALPDLSRDFDAPAGVADWFLLAFLLANTASILVFGRISDLVGRRRIYLAGMTAFMVLSVLATIAPDAGTFIAVRALQGVSAATIVANTSALVADAFPEHRLAYGLSLNLTAASVANTAGPTIGGLLVSAAGWQAVFLVNVPFGLAALLLGLRMLPAPRPRTGPRETFDAKGAVLSAAALAALLYGVNRLSTAGPADLGVWALLTAGVLLFVTFGLLERKLEHPLVDLALIRDKGRACAYGAAFFQSFGRAGVTVLVVLQQQIVAARSAAEAGFMGMAMALAMVVATPVSGRLAAVLTARTLTAIGGTLSVVGLVGLALSPATAPLPLTMGWLLLVGAGIGLFTTPNTTAIMRGVPAARRTVANAVRSMLYNSGAALGTSVALLVVSASGIAGYDVQDAGPAVRAAFTVALLVCAAAEAVAFAFGVARGGPWRIRPPVPERPLSGIRGAAT